MTDARNETHDPALRSWVSSANTAETDFPVQNLPFGVFRHRDDPPRVGVAIGDHIFDVARGEALGLFAGAAAEAAVACRASSLNALMGLGHEHWSALRQRLSALLRTGGDARADEALVAMADCTMLLPAEVGDYTDFYCSIYHASNVGAMFRPDNPLMPNYKHLPVGYHGRASSLVVSGTPVRRPCGQLMADGAEAPVFGPSRLFDYELELGFFVGSGNAMGERIPIAAADNSLFGYCLVNDWSARDIQKWEYQPLGPFLGKSFATSLSPWVVTTEALAPFRVPAFERAAEDPQPLDYLDDSENRQRGGIDLHLEVYIHTEAMRTAGDGPARISRGNARDLYWTSAQMLTHHASNGCNLRPGDLLASGTVSGKERDARGCLLERTWRGSEPVELPNGEIRKFLLDGDEVILRGECTREGAARIGFGECRGQVLAAQP